MKIRTDFVTNSSSSSFIVFDLELFFKNGKKKKWGPFCAYTEMSNGEDYVNGLYADFPCAEASIDVYDLLQTKSVEEFTRVFYDAFSGDEYDEDDNLLRLFTLEKNGLLWEKKEFGDRDQLKKICLTQIKGTDYDEGSHKNIYSFDFETEQFEEQEEGDEIYAESDGCGSVSFTNYKIIERQRLLQYEKEEQNKLAELKKRIENSFPVLSKVEQIEGKTFVLFVRDLKDIYYMTEYVLKNDGVVQSWVGKKTYTVVIDLPKLSEEHIKALFKSKKEGAIISIIFKDDFKKQIGYIDESSNETAEEYQKKMLEECTWVSSVPCFSDQYFMLGLGYDQSFDYSKELKSLGATVQSSITDRTNYLVIGSEIEQFSLHELRYYYYKIKTQALVSHTVNIISYDTLAKALRNLTPDEKAQIKTKLNAKKSPEKLIQELQSISTIVKHIDIIEGKQFTVFGGLYAHNDLVPYINNHNGEVRDTVIGRTNYVVIVFPEKVTKKQIESIRVQYERGNRLGVIFYEDFEKQIHNSDEKPLKQALNKNQNKRQKETKNKAQDGEPHEVDNNNKEKAQPKKKSSTSPHGKQAPNSTQPQEIITSEGKVLCIIDNNGFLTFPDDCDYIFTDQVYLCKNKIQSVFIHEGIKEIQYGSFRGCDKLKRVVISKGINIIDEGTFNNCESLESITIPEGVKEICAEAFSNCESITRVALPYGLETIGAEAFYECLKLCKVTFPLGIKQIGRQSFEACEDLRTVYLPDGVMSIESEAFNGCASLESITIPESVSYISSDAFEDCPDLTIYGKAGSYADEFANENDLAFKEIPDGDWDIRDEILYHYFGNSHKVIIPDSVIHIYSFAFCNNTFIQEIVIPESVTLIDDYSFRGCSGLKSIRIPNNVSEIGNWAFSGCTGLTEVTIPDGIEKIGDYAFENCILLKAVQIPEGIKRIGSWAFSGCKALENIDIPKSLEYKGFDILKNCSLGKTSIDKSESELSEKHTPASFELFGDDKEDVSTPGEHCIEDTSAIVCDDWVITVPAGYLYSTDAEIVGHRPLVLGLDDGTLDFSSPFDATINFSVTILPMGAQGDRMPDLPLDHPLMAGYVQLIDEPKSVYIRKDADIIINYRIMNFYHDEPCISRGYILTRHNIYAFQLFDHQSNNKTEAESILRRLLLSIKTKDECEGKQFDTEAVLNKLTDIHQRLQAMKSQMQEIVQKQEEKSLKNEPVNNNVASSLNEEKKEKKRSAGNKRIKLTIENGVLLECHTNDPEIIIPEGVTKIAENVFFNRKKLKSVKIPSSVSSIGDMAFAYSGITSIEIPETVTKIGNYLFFYCKALSQVKLPENMQSIPDGLFSDCANLISVNIPESVETIGSRAFCGCFSIPFIKLPDGLDFIKYETFLACRALSMIEIPDSVEIIESQTFAGCYNLKSISLPITIKSINKNAFSACDINEIIVRNGVAKLKEKLKSYEHYLKQDKYKIEEQIPEEAEKDKYEKQVESLEDELNSLAFYHLKRKKYLQTEIVNCNKKLDSINSIINSKKEAQQKFQERISFYEEEIKRINTEIVAEQNKSDKIIEMVKDAMKSDS